MVMQLLGFQKISFVNNSGEAINGSNLYLGYKHENVNGIKTDKFFIKDNIVIPKNINLNDMLNVSFTNTGKIESISKA